MERLAVPEVVSHYRIIRRLGVGGMGEVYLAQDTILDRRVAIKFLRSACLPDETALKRLIREARAAARLDHPGICSVYEVVDGGSTPFIVMQHVEGDTLAALVQRGPLAFDQTLDIAGQVAAALAEAHAHGVVHRDVKPQNIMITSRGQAKLMDFGLARLTEPLAGMAETRTGTGVAEPSAVAGTVAYMSPEQARGRAVDVRSDIFSFGVTLYEAISGRSPFESASLAETLSAILTEDVPPLAGRAVEVPSEWERVLRKCLEKNPDDRYQSATELAIDIARLKKELQHGRTPSARQPAMQRARLSRRAVLAVALLGLTLAAPLVYSRRGSTTSEPITSLAVLPFMNVGGNPDTEYLSDGLTESLINRLAQLPSVKLQSRNSVMRYRGREADAQAVARELGVQAILTGRLAQRGGVVSVNAELIDGTDGRHLWGNQFERANAALHTLPEDLAREVALRLSPEATAGQRELVGKRDTHDPEAYRLYLRGRYHWSKLSPDGWQKGTEYFQQAIERDPAYALAYAGLADCYNLRGIFSLIPPRDAFPKAKQAATQALSINERLAEAHVSLGITRFYFDWDWPAAEHELRRAIELNPEYSYAHSIQGIYLSAMRRFDEAVAASHRAQELDPLSTVATANAGLVRYFAGRPDEAIIEFRKALELDPNYFTAHFWLGNTYARAGRYPEALVELDRSVELSAGQPVTVAALGRLYALSGDRPNAARMLRRLHDLERRQYVSPYFFALVHEAMGDRAQALEWLEKAFLERSTWLARLNVEPWMDPLRVDPAFVNLARRVGHQ